MARPVLYLNMRKRKTTMSPHVEERRNTMTIEQVLLVNGAQYLWAFGLLGLLALAWARLERER